MLTICVKSKPNFTRKTLPCTAVILVRTVATIYDVSAGSSDYTSDSGSVGAGFELISRFEKIVFDKKNRSEVEKGGNNPW